MKTCSKCHQVKPLEDFTVNNAARDGRRPECKPCRNKAKRRSGWRGPSGSVRLPKGSSW